MLITRPARRNSPTEEKLCDRDINMPLKSPHELNDSREAKDRFKWRIDEKAIIFFRSKYLKQEQATISSPNSVQDRKTGRKNCSGR